MGDRPLAVFNTDEGFRVIDNTCTHMGGTLADGLVSDATVACPLHDRRFELATGRAVGHDCGAVGAYPVEVHEGAVYASVPVFDLGESQAVVGGASSDDQVTTGDEESADEEEAAPVQIEERGEGPAGEDASDSLVDDGEADELPAEAKRPIEAKAGLREPQGAQS
ncbi:MAG: Rieske 2Fe-2S domain-containing protein [Actinomycetota bacterium]|nr:Rieske 2Fe-2S domain-containing protein [Actinomycetota bacterium]